jgi:hypothetical protein
MVMALVLVIGTAGCQSTPIPLGESGRTKGEFRMGRLDVQFDRSVTVATIISAGESVLVRRGYTIVKRFTSEDKARVMGSYPNPVGASWDAEVYVENALAGPTMMIRAGLGGDLGEARDIANDVLTLLGR